MYPSVNVVVLTGYLTRDPELRSMASGSVACKLRLGVKSRTRDSQTGKFGTRPNYFDVVVWGAQGENCARLLSKGRQVAVDGRLDWREYEGRDGARRQSVSVVADTVQFLGPRSGDENGGPEEEDDSSSGSGDGDALSDKRLMRLRRPELDELAAEIGVETPEEYREKRDLLDAIREKEAEKARADEVEETGGEDLDF